MALFGEGTIGATFAAVPCRQQSQQAVVAVKLIGVTSLSKEVVADPGYLEEREIFCGVCDAGAVESGAAGEGGLEHGPVLSCGHPCNTPDCNI